MMSLLFVFACENTASDNSPFCVSMFTGYKILKKLKIDACNITSGIKTNLQPVIAVGKNQHS